MVQYFEIPSQVMYYNVDLYGALEPKNPRTTADTSNLETLEKTTVHNGKMHDVGMLWAEARVAQQIFLSAGSFNIFVSAGYKKPALTGEVFKYHHRGSRERLPSTCQRFQQCRKLFAT